jgi:DNA-binding NarL/FixJ family response regulator
MYFFHNAGHFEPKWPILFQSNFHVTGRPSVLSNVARMDQHTRIVIAEDHTLMAEGLRKLLQSDFEFVETVANGRELLDVVAIFKPDIVLLDIGMPLLNGIEATRRFAKISPATKVVIVTAHNEPQYVVEAFRAGATGFVLKRCAVSELVTAIRLVLSGHTYVTPLMADRALEAAKEAVPTGPALTSRQREVLQLVAEGCTAKEIANVLKLSVKTAVFHKMAIMDKLGLRTTAELTRYALEHGIANATSERITLPLANATSTGAGVSAYGLSSKNQ